MNDLNKIITRADIIAEALTWIDTPFNHQGRIKGEACDCAGLIIGVAHGVGLTDFDVTNYGRLPVPKEMERILDENMDRVKYGQEKPGDVAWMRHPRPHSEPRHVGIIDDKGCIIHAYEEVEKVVRHSFTRDWRDRTVRFYRFRGIDE